MSATSLQPDSTVVDANGVLFTCNRSESRNISSSCELVRWSEHPFIQEYAVFEFCNFLGCAFMILAGYYIYSVFQLLNLSKAFRSRKWCTPAHMITLTAPLGMPFRTESTFDEKRSRKDQVGSRSRVKALFKFLPLASQLAGSIRSCSFAVLMFLGAGIQTPIGFHDISSSVQTMCMILVGAVSPFQGLVEVLSSHRHVVSDVRVENDKHKASRYKRFVLINLVFHVGLVVIAIVLVMQDVLTSIPQLWRCVQGILFITIVTYVFYGILQRVRTLRKVQNLLLTQTRAKLQPSSFSQRRSGVSEIEAVSDNIRRFLSTKPFRGDDEASHILQLNPTAQYLTLLGRRYLLVVFGYCIMSIISLTMTVTPWLNSFSFYLFFTVYCYPVGHLIVEAITLRNLGKHARRRPQTILPAGGPTAINNHTPSSRNHVVVADNEDTYDVYNFGQQIGSGKKSGDLGRASPRSRRIGLNALNPGTRLVCNNINGHATKHINGHAVDNIHSEVRSHRHPSEEESSVASFPADDGTPIFDE